MLKGFRDFLLRGNLVELAVAFIMGAVFAALVTAFTKMIMDIIGLVIAVPSFSGYIPGGVHVGDFITAGITLVLTGAVVYFLIVVPYTRLSNLREQAEPAAAASTDDLLADIRDLLRQQLARAGGRGQTGTTGGGTTDGPGDSTG